MELENIDLTNMDTSDLLALSRLIEQEYSRRRVLEEALAQAEGLAKSYLEASGRLAVADAEGNPPANVPEYVQPLGAHDAYPLDIYATQDGEIYRSRRSGNVCEPKLHPELWEEVNAEDVPPQPETPPAPEWEVGKAYAVGDLLTYKGKTYRIVQAHTSAAHWTPDAVPALYKVVA